MFPLELKLLAYLSGDGPASCLHGASLCKKNAVRAKSAQVLIRQRLPASLGSWALYKSRPRGGADRICAVSMDRTSWTGGGASLIGCHSAGAWPSLRRTKTRMRLRRSQIICK